MSSMKGSSSDKISTLRGLALISLRSSVDKLFYHPQAQPTKPGAVPRTHLEAKELAPPASAHARSARRPGVRGVSGPAALSRAKPGSGVGHGKCARVMNHLGSLRGHLHNMEAVADAGFLSAVQGGDLVTFRAELVGTREDLVGIKAELGPALAVAGFFGWVPVVGGDVSAAPDLLQMGIGVTTAGDSLFEGMEPLVYLVSGSADAPSSMGMRETLALAAGEGQPPSEAARA